jgi:hypothetical protein
VCGSRIPCAFRRPSAGLEWGQTKLRLDRSITSIGPASLGPGSTLKSAFRDLLRRSGTRCAARLSGKKARHRDELGELRSARATIRARAARGADGRNRVDSFFDELFDLSRTDGKTGAHNHTATLQRARGDSPAEATTAPGNSDVNPPASPISRRRLATKAMLLLREGTRPRVEVTSKPVMQQTT